MDYIIWLSEFLAMCIGVFITTWFIRKFFWKWLVVRLSAGKKVLVCVFTKLGREYAVGSYEGDYLKIKFKKKTKYITFDENAVFRDLGVNWVFVDSNSWSCFNKKSFETIPVDMEVINNIIVRALTKPSLQFDTLKIVMVIGIVACCAVGLLNWYNISDIDHKLDLQKSSLESYIDNRTSLVIENLTDTMIEQSHIVVPSQNNVSVVGVI